MDLTKNSKENAPRSHVMLVLNAFTGSPVVLFVFKGDI